jgi:ATP-binding cassette subfamily F protein 3
MLQFENLALRRGTRLLFEQASFQIHPGQKVGVAGANGTGKSSLFALILDELHADDGEFRRPGDWVIAHVAQETPSERTAAVEYLLDGDAELRRLETDVLQAELDNAGERLAILLGQFEAIGGYTARSRAGQLLSGLGFRRGDENRAVGEFSGGWRMRLSLARALMCRSDLLLLDEPTNHLDLDTVLWLENWLCDYPGTLLLISHDRDFLDRVCGQILHIEGQRLTLYNGNYSAFECRRTEQLAHRQAEYAKQQREIAHIHSYIERFRAKASKARQAQSRLKALQRMEQIAPAHVDSPFHFALRKPEKTPDGKSTLIKLLAGTLAPRYGQRQTAQDLRIGYFAQHQLEQLHPSQSPLEHLQRLDPAAREQELRDYLGGFGFSGDQALRHTAPFSGGEKSRLVLALLVYQRPNLLLLDEPTNHLDLEMRQALALALQEFSGAMVLVSHDRHLLRVTADRLLLVHAGRVDEFPGSLDDYPGWLGAHNRQERAIPEENRVAGSAAARKDKKRLEAEQRMQLQPLRSRIRAVETTLAELHARQKELEQRLAEPELYQVANKVQLKTLLLEKADVDGQCTVLETEWLEVGEQLEVMQAGD